MNREPENPQGTPPAAHTSASPDEMATETARPPSYFLRWAGLSAALLWCAQPPFSLWPIAFIALVPLLRCCEEPRMSRKSYLAIYLAAGCYWLISLQGIRHAHVALYAGWIVLSLYLAVYWVAFVIVVKRLLAWHIPMVISVPVAWVGGECIRNYLFTGISAAMLGHAVADVRWMIQIADLGGSYAVSFVIASCSAALYEAWRKQRYQGLVVAGVLIAATIAYGVYRTGESTSPGTTRIALIQCNEPVEWVMSEERSLEIFEAYLRQSINAVQGSDQIIDAVVWPESMFTGGIPWVASTPPESLASKMSEGQNVTPQEIIDWYRGRAGAFEFRAAQAQELLAGKGPQFPDLLVGCAVVTHDSSQHTYSGVVHIDSQSNVSDWYGKMHLLVFGEYFPLVRFIPYVRDRLPDGGGIATGDGPRIFEIGSCKIAPNICIETAVERVTINQFATLRTGAGLPDAVVTVTNDAWYDDSSIIAHHRRCTQLVAVGCRRPILSSANNGPTAWIDSCGQIVDSVPQGETGSVIASPAIDPRESLYVKIGDWPARLLGLVFVLGLVSSCRRRVRTYPKTVNETNGPVLT